jgi:hypothetical protein
MERVKKNCQIMENWCRRQLHYGRRRRQKNRKTILAADFKTGILNSTSWSLSLSLSVIVDRCREKMHSPSCYGGRNLPENSWEWERKTASRIHRQRWKDRFPWIKDSIAGSEEQVEGGWSWQRPFKLTPRQHSRGRQRVEADAGGRYEG